MKIVVLDKGTLGEDIDLSPIYAMGDVKEYESTTEAEISKRLENAEAVIVNKIKLNESNLMNAKKLKIICVAATGFDNIDISYCKKAGIGVCNVPGYSTDSVAQVTLSMALYLATHLKEYERYVKDGSYSKSHAANKLSPIYHELSSFTWGVVGGGGIGTRVAQIALSLGCRVLMFRKKTESEFNLTDIDTLCKESDIISLHIPLTPETEKLINSERIALMKKNAIVINTARGGVADEQALADAVKSGRIGGLGVDVYTKEPFGKEHPYFEIMNYDNVCFTPHMAWGSFEARNRCINIIAQNIRSFINSEDKNRIV